MNISQSARLDRERWLVRWDAETDSTQSRASELGLRAGKLGGRWLFAGAAAQTAGRGRSGARWEANPGDGILFTVGTELAAPAERWPLASLVVGAALAEALERWCGREICCKWPNDLLARDDGRWRKLGGCLAERVERPGLPALWLIGVGINLRHAGLPDALWPFATSLETLNPAADPGSVEACCHALAESVRAAISAWQHAGWRLDRDTLQARLAFAGDPITVDLGSSQVDGILRGVAADGRLLLELEGGAVVPLLPLAITGADSDPPWHPPPRSRTEVP